MTEKPDLFMYTSALLACENGQDWEQAIFILDEIQRNGYNLTTVAVTSAIAACAAAGRATEALQLLDKMETENVPRNVWTFNAAIAACSKQGRWRDALSVFEKMRADLSETQGAEAGAGTATATDTGVVVAEQASLVPLDAARIISSSNNILQEEEREESVWRLPEAQPTSNSVTIVSLTEVLAGGGQGFLVDEVYREAIGRRVVQPFQHMQRGWIDLHCHSVHMSHAALRLSLELLLQAAVPNSLPARPPRKRGDDPVDPDTLRCAASAPTRVSLHPRALHRYRHRYRHST
mmetsp:Transcript_2822/g.6509  ORF Transcript_2822/g.6509 Transcript_2822/m.6509 type:complete len:292 (-) Transcript_2822:69-944(-)